MPNRSDLIDELAKALCKVQAEMKPAPKNRTNPFFKAGYADMVSVHDTTRPLLSKNGLCISQTMGEAEGTPSSKLRLTTLLMHSSGQWISSDVPLTPLKNDAQALGSYISYMRRYAEMAIIGLASEEDDDGEASMDRKKRSQDQMASSPPPASKITVNGNPVVTKPQLARLFAISNKNGWRESEASRFIEENFGKKSSKDLSWKEYEKLITHIEAHPRRREPGADG